MIHHSEAFFPIAPIGSHCRKKKYDREKASKRGSRTVNKNMWNGRWVPAGSVGIGRKGAMPEPLKPEHQRRNLVEGLVLTTSVCAPLSRNCENFSILVCSCSVSFSRDHALGFHCQIKSVSMVRTLCTEANETLSESSSRPCRGGFVGSDWH